MRIGGRAVVCDGLAPGAFTVTWSPARRVRCVLGTYRLFKTAAPDEQLGTARSAVGLTTGGWEIPGLADVDGDGLQDGDLVEALDERPCRLAHAGSQSLRTRSEDLRPTGCRLGAAITAADFNGDGLGDVPLFNPGHQAARRVAPTRQSRQPSRTSFDGPAGAGWVAACAGDFDGDGLADVGWNNTIKATTSFGSCTERFPFAGDPSFAGLEGASGPPLQQTSMGMAVTISFGPKRQPTVSLCG